MTTSLRSCGTSPPSLQEVNSVVSLSKTLTEQATYSSARIPPMPGASPGCSLATAAVISCSFGGLFTSSSTFC